MSIQHFARRGFLNFVGAAALSPIVAGTSHAERLLDASDIVSGIPDLPILGNPDGDLTIAEFIDYNCGYCRQMQPDITRLLNKDGRIRLVVMEWPILGASSIKAAQVALAAAAQGRFAPFHAALFATRGPVDAAALSRAARAADIDLRRLNIDLDERHDALITTFRRVNKVAEVLGFNATPSLLIGNHPVPGALSYDELKGLVDGVRRLR